MTDQRGNYDRMDYSGKPSIVRHPDSGPCLRPGKLQRLGRGDYAFCGFTEGCSMP